MPRVKTHIIGCGDIGRRVASLYLEVGTKVEAWVRSEVSCQACRDLGLKTHKVDFDLPFGLDTIGINSHILYTIPPPPGEMTQKPSPLTKGDRGGELARGPEKLCNTPADTHGRHPPKSPPAPLCQRGGYSQHDAKAGNISDNRLRAFLQAIDPGAVSKFVLISTTGVYGDCGGAWVDETTPIKPKVDRALRRADAEASLQEWAQKNRVDYLILRVPGIYALDRLPLKRLRAGTPMVAQNEAPWTNRIHADDLAAVCFAAFHSPVANEIINVADDAPSSMTEYFFAVADYAGLPRPPEISLQQARQSLSSGMLSYLAESRRIDNGKMKKLLNIKLKYPTLKHGLTLNTPFS